MTRYTSIIRGPVLGSVSSACRVLIQPHPRLSEIKYTTCSSVSARIFATSTERIRVPRSSHSRNTTTSSVRPFTSSSSLLSSSPPSSSTTTRTHPPFKSSPRYTPPPRMDLLQQIQQDPHATSLYISGSPCPAASSSPTTTETINPATGTPITTLPHASTDDINSAIASSKAAFPSWRDTPAIERSRILLRAAQQLRERNEELAHIESLDTGRPVSETGTVDVVGGADVLEYYANLVGGGGLSAGGAERVKLRSDAWVYTSVEPLGVCVGIGAWNYPLQMYVQEILTFFLVSSLNAIPCTLTIPINSIGVNVNSQNTI